MYARSFVFRCSSTRAGNKQTHANTMQLNWIKCGSSMMLPNARNANGPPRCHATGVNYCVKKSH
eukprot:3413657-Lingulodinium_polyedra.AAC.1